MSALDEMKYSINEITTLHQDEVSCNNPLQIFINKVVKYAQLKLKFKDYHEINSSE